MAKGIRVNQVAKELGIESRVILEKFRREDPPIEVPNHQSTISLGLAETIREWFRAGEMDDLIKKHSAPTAESASAKKKAPAKKKKAGDDSADDTGGGTAVLVDESETTDTSTDTISSSEPTVDTDATSVDIAAEVGAEVPAVEPQVITETPVPTTPTVEAPAAPVVVAEAPATVSAPAPMSGAKAVLPQPPARPTVRLEKASASRPERPRVVATPFTPKPAVLAGPKVVREEKPDVVSAPRKRLPPGQSGPQTGIGGTVPSQARGGRGVRVVEEEDEGSDKKPGAAAGAKKGPVTTRRRGPDGRRGEADEKLREFSDADLKDRADRISAASAARQATDMHLRKTEARGTHVQARTAAQRGGVLEIDEPITVRSLSTDLGVKSNELMTKLIRQGVFATLNQTIDFDTASMLALDYSVELKIRREPTLEEQLMAEFDAQAAASMNLQPRSPVVTILGHVDHGKTSLLDRIRSANVAAGEAGGITQHIAAWKVVLGDKRVTFIDTPGHQAFTAMRARGANMTDVVVLVVSAAEGVQPQTVESINHAKAAGVPIIVAMNKIDRDDANPDMVLGQLAANGLNPVEWGGDTEVVRTSATKGIGIAELIEILDYQTQLRELKADPDGPSRGVVIESRMDSGLGPIATVLVQQGTLNVGDVILAGQGWGRIRSLRDDRLKVVDDAGPSTPVIISGLSELPSAGDKFFEIADLDRARSISAERLSAQRAFALASKQQVSLDSIYGQMRTAAIKTINLIIKCDVQGSVETLQKTVIDQNTDEVRVKVIHAAAGPISESDVELADASGAVIIGFHVVPDESARQMAEQRRIEVRTYRVIYEIFDDLKKALSGMLEPEVREKLHGHVEVRALFKVSRLGVIAGCMVTDGHIQRGSKIRLIRDGKIITEDLSIESLKRLKDDVKEVKSGFECGIKLSGYNDLKMGDRLEGYIRETIQRTL